MFEVLRLNEAVMDREKDTAMVDGRDREYIS